jgi:hypothetical protein
MTTRRAVIVFVAFLGVLGTSALALVAWLASNLCLSDSNEPAYVCEHPGATRTVVWNVVSFVLPPLAALVCAVWASKAEKWGPLIVVLAAPLAVLLLDSALAP